MLVVRHETLGPGGGAVWRQDELRSRDLVFVRSRYEGGYRDETFCPERTEGCSSIRFVLGGPMVTRGGVELRAGHLHASATHGTAMARSLEPTSDVLIIGWRGGRAAGGVVVHDLRIAPHPSTALCLHRLADALADRHQPRMRIAMAAHEALAALRSEGFPFLVTSVPDDTAEQPLATAVASSLVELASQPTSVELSRALGVGEHHALRRANAYFRQFYLSSNGWREYLRRRRVDLGAFFMGRADARTEDVARALGFRSPTSFCHAFQAAGLPSPRAVQSHLLAS